ncbi:calcium-binding protein [Actinoplanes sp. NPDC049596]|uniref:calcium-binding protein n=1 Tax=unclassified Actinoplanes TaxID=2626549 RepID=UPI00341E627D
MKIGKKPARVAIAVVGAVGVSGVAWLAMPAEAATGGIVSVSGNRVTYTAAAKRTNQVIVTRSGNTIVVDDTTTAIKAGSGCGAVSGDKTKIRCALKVAPGRIVVSLLDGNDSFLNKTDVAVTVAGGTGNDRIYGGSKADSLQGNDGNDAIWGQGGADNLVGGNGNDAIAGGDGDDVLDGANGNDRLLGGNGDDIIAGQAGKDSEQGDGGDDTFLQLLQYAAGTDADVLVGGAGLDAVDYSIVYRTKAIRADADGVAGDDGAAGEKDTISGTIEAILGGAGNDVLVGSSRVDYLLGGPGNDVIGAGAGNDFLAGEEGRDTLNGAAGIDSCLQDYDNDTFISCEQLSSDLSAKATNGRASFDAEAVRAKEKALS